MLNNTTLQSNNAGLQAILNTINDLPNANSVVIDPTLTKEGQAADAKAVGEAIESKAPAYTYGTADMTAGTSALETGKLYFVYE